MIKLFFAFVFCTLVGTLSAADVTPVRTSPSNKWIIIDKAMTKYNTLSVTITKLDGTVLVREAIKKTTKYNLKYVPDGEYKLILEDVQKVNTQLITLVNNQVVTTESSIVYKPHYVHTGHLVDMTLMAQGKDVNIVIRNQQGEAIKKEYIKNEVSVSRRFNMKALEKGNYYIDVHLNGQVFIYELTI